MRDKTAPQERLADQAVQASHSETLSLLIRNAGRAVARLYATTIEVRGVNLSTWVMLRLIAAGDGPTQREIAAHLGITEPSAVETLLSMEARGLITRARSTIDRRRMVVKLTVKGRELLDRTLPIALDVDDAIARAVAAEKVAVLSGALKEITELLSSAAFNATIKKQIDEKYGAPHSSSRQRRRLRR